MAVFDLVVFPKQIIKVFVKSLAYGYAQTNSWIVVTFFYGIYSLSGNTYKVCELLLGKVLGSSCGF